MAQTVKRLPTMWETWVQFLGREDLLEKEMATDSSILACKIPWMEESGYATVHRVAKSRTRLSDFTHFAHSNQCEVVPRSFDLHFSNKITFLSKTQKT